jgi:hypothetical protein
MRSIVAAAAVWLLLAWALPGNTLAVGLQAVGKEPCNCDPLVARGIVPDPVNKLKSAVDFPQISGALDRLAADVRTFLAQFGSGGPSNGAAEVVAKAEPPERVVDKPPTVEKPRVKPKKKVAKKAAKKPKAKKKVKKPAQAM